MKINISPLQVTLLTASVQKAETLLKGLGVNQWVNLARTKKNLIEQLIAMDKVIKAGNEIAEDETLEIEIFPVIVKSDTKFDGFHNITLLFEHNVLKSEDDEEENKPISS